MNNLTTTTTTTVSSNSRSINNKGKRKYQDPSSIERSVRQKLVQEVDNNAIDADYLRSKRLAWKRIENFIQKEYRQIRDDGDPPKVRLDQLTVAIFKDFVGGLSRPSLVDGHRVLKVTLG